MTINTTALQDLPGDNGFFPEQQPKASNYHKDGSGYCWSETFEFLAPEDRAVAALVSKSLNKSQINAGNAHLKALGVQPAGSNPNKQIYELVSHLKDVIHLYPEVQVPADIQAILESVTDENGVSIRTLTIRETRQLQEFIKARDTIVVWYTLAYPIGKEAEVIRSKEEGKALFNNSSSVISKAEGFSKWMDSNQEALNEIIELNLSNNKLTHLPPEIGNLTQLRELYLKNNQLTHFPAEIGKLTSLRILGLYQNQLKQLPPEIGSLTELRDLYLENNQLTQLPKEIGNLAQLQGLSLDHNQLKQLPVEIGGLTNLKWLNLSNNQLTQLPAKIRNLRLQIFLAFGNQLNLSDTIYWGLAGALPRNIFLAVGAIGLLATNAPSAEEIQSFACRVISPFVDEGACRGVLEQVANKISSLIGF